MSDSLITYLYSRQQNLVDYCNNTMLSQRELFPLYTTWDSETLDQRGNAVFGMLIRAMESGDFEEVKSNIHKTFSSRLRSGFEPNELIRLIDIVNETLLTAVANAPACQELKDLYTRRMHAQWQVAKMYVAMLNLEIPKEDRNEIEPKLLTIDD